MQRLLADITAGRASAIRSAPSSPTSSPAVRYWNRARQRYHRLSTRYSRACVSLPTQAARPGPDNRGKPQLLDLERRIPARDRFALDSPLEGYGFEPSVPRTKNSPQDGPLSKDSVPRETVNPDSNLASSSEKSARSSSLCARAARSESSGRGRTCPPIGFVSPSCLPSPGANFWLETGGGSRLPPASSQKRIGVLPLLRGHMGVVRRRWSSVIVPSSFRMILL
jgi:hypothetical protein